MAKFNEQLNEARATGAKTYFTGQPCKNGHIAIRDTRSSTCAECVVIYSATYLKKTPGRVKAWINANKDKYLATARAYKASRPEKVREASKLDYRRNIEKRKACQLKYRTENPEVVKESRNKWRAKNYDLLNAKESRRRAALFQALPNWANAIAIGAMFEEAVRLSMETGIAHEVDHIVPLVHPLVCGLHCEANMQVISASQNRRKSNKFQV